MIASSRKFTCSQSIWSAEILTIHRALYLRGDPYERSDAVFGVKESLVVDLGTVSEVKGLAEKYEVDPSTKLLQYDFVLVTDEETENLRNKKALEAMKKQGAENMRIVNGVLIPNVD